MLALFRVIVERLKALFVADMALEFEAELLAREAERRAGLLRQADRYEAEGLHELAEQLRHRAKAQSIDRPLASVLPALDHWQIPVQQPSPAQPDGKASAPALGLDRRIPTAAAPRKGSRQKRG